MGSNQSILKELSPGCSLEGLMLKLKLQYFGHLMRRVDSLEKTLMLGGVGGRRRGRQRMRWFDGITDSMDVSSKKAVTVHTTSLHSFWHAIVVVVQSLSHVQLFVTPGTAAHQASLSFTISLSLLI